MLHIDNSKVLWKDIDGAVTVLLFSSGEFFELNKVGGAVWRRLVEGKARDAIVDELVTQFGAPKAQIGKDVDGFIAQMVERGLLEQ